MKLGGVTLKVVMLTSSCPFLSLSTRFDERHAKNRRKILLLELKVRQEHPPGRLADGRTLNARSERKSGFTPDPAPHL